MGIFSTPDRQETAASRILLVAILAAAALLRAFDLDRTSLWYDEAVSWNQSRGTFEALIAAVSADNYPPLHNFILWLVMPVIGDSEIALRLPSALLGILAVWLIYVAGKTLAGKSAGLLAATLLTISPFHIWYSTEARMYALMAATGLAFLSSVMKVLETGGRRWILALSLAGSLFLYSHVYAVLGFAATGAVCACLALMELAGSRRLRFSNALAACLAMAVSATAFLPWLLILLSRVNSVAKEGFWIAYPDLPFLKTMLFEIAGSVILFWILLAFALGFLVHTFVGSSATPDREQAWRQMALATLAYTFGPPLLAYLYSVLVQPILFDRYLIAAWPGLILLASAGASRVCPRITGMALFLAALLLTWPQLKFNLFEKIRPEWREISRDYLALSAPDDRLLLYKGFAAPALAYYLREENAFTPAVDIATLEALRNHEKSGWLLIVHSGPQETQRAIQAAGADEESIAAQRFGWGASGLKLLKIKPTE